MPLATPTERLALIERLVGDVGDGSPTVAPALLTASNLAFERGDHGGAAAFARRAGDLFDAAGDRRLVAWCRFFESFGSWGLADLEGAGTSITAALSIFDDLGDQYGSAYAMWMASQLTVDLQRGEALAVRAESLHRQLGSTFALAHVLEGRALIALQSGRRGDAAPLLREALAAFVDAGYAGCSAHCLEAIAAVTSDVASVEVTVELVGAADELREVSGHTHRPWELRSHEAALAALRGSPDAAVVRAGRQRGRCHDLRSVAGLTARALDRL